MRCRILCLATLLLVLAAIAGCQANSIALEGPGYRKIVVYAFSTEQKVLTEEIFPAFSEHWKSQTGQEVIFESLFGGSEELTDAIISGARADVAILSNEQHALWLHVNDLATSDWHSLPNEGIVSRSPLVIVVRPDNPKGITDWRDLSRPGVQVIHPDPRSSGGAQWAVLAEYGAALLGEAGDQATAAEQLRSIWANVVATPSSSCDALRQFLFGAGDALITYEQDALLAQARGADLLVIAPTSTIMSEHVAVVVDQNVRPDEREVVDQFMNFLWGEQAQEAFAGYYFRPVIPLKVTVSSSKFMVIDDLFTVDDLGGWGSAYANIIHGVWNASDQQGRPAVEP